MQKLTKINIGKLNNEAHYQFHENVTALIKEAEIANLPQIAHLYQPYLKAVENEKDALDFITKAELTAAVEEQDRVRDERLRGFIGSIKYARNHFDPEVRKAANKIWGIILHYSNNRKRNSYDSETAAINDMLREFERPDLAQAIAAVNHQDWVQALADENGRFNNLILERGKERIEKTPFRMVNARPVSEAFFRVVADTLNGYIIAGGNSAQFDKFIACLEEEIIRWKHKIAREYGRKNGETEDGNVVKE